MKKVVDNKCKIWYSSVRIRDRLEIEVYLSLILTGKLIKNTEK